jgi:hypothetical protein
MRRLVAVRDHVYVTLGLDAPVSKLDAATGEVLFTYPKPLHVEELLWVDGKLVAISSTDPNTEPFSRAYACRSSRLQPGRACPGQSA